MKIDKNYWDNLYLNKALGWDIGYTSTPLKEYFNQLNEKDIKILIPGGGNGYEAEYLWTLGFKNTYYLDFSEYAVENFKKRCPLFPDERILNEDFFEHTGTYDLIVELAFFTSVEPDNRENLADKLYQLINSGGKYVGLFFNHEFKFSQPPYGALKENYLELIKDKFTVKTFETAYNSIKPRDGRELFFIFEKK